MRPTRGIHSAKARQMQSLQLDYYSVERRSFHARQLLVPVQGTGLAQGSPLKYGLISRLRNAPLDEAILNSAKSALGKLR